MGLLQRRQPDFHKGRLRRPRLFRTLRPSETLPGPLRGEPGRTTGRVLRDADGGRSRPGDDTSDDASANDFVVHAAVSERAARTHADGELGRRGRGKRPGHPLGSQPVRGRGRQPRDSLHMPHRLRRGRQQAGGRVPAATRFRAQLSAYALPGAGRGDGHAIGLAGKDERNLRLAGPSRSTGLRSAAAVGVRAAARAGAAGRFRR